MSLARSYAITARHFAYASPASPTPTSTSTFVNSNGQAIKPSFRHIRVSCISHAPLQVATITCQQQAPSQKELYDLCVQKQILPPDRQHLFSALPLAAPAQAQMKQYKIFALDLNTLESSALESSRAYEDLSAHILIPLILLPLAQDRQVSGVFLLDDWLCVYENGALLYECVCKDASSLQDALNFISSMYGVYDSLKTLHYYQALPHAALESSSLDSRTPITKPLYQVLDESLHTQRFAPLYNPNAKQLLQTDSFWWGLRLVACSALILALPFGKLAYASYLDSRTSDLQAHNAHLSQTIQAKHLNASKLPHQNTQITDTIHHLYTIKSHYTSRLEILATLSQAAKDHEAWITYLELKGALEKGETLLELSCQSQKQENLHTLLSSLQQTSKLEIISTEEEQSPSDVFATRITLKISYA